MLQALDVHDGHTVLEIGTDTGYNTALLCHRLGSDNVTIMDVDPALITRAAERLTALDYTPHRVAGDARARFRRVGTVRPNDRHCGTRSRARRVDRPDP
ncbi:MAG: hypothetical protein ACRDTG_20430 [Pseudonocardiaceae bacterium]